MVKLVCDVLLGDGDGDRRFSCEWTNREMLHKIVVVSIKNTFHLRLFVGECVRDVSK